MHNLRQSLSNWLTNKAKVEPKTVQGIRSGDYRGLIGTPKTKNSRRTLPMPESFKDGLKRLSEKAASGEQLIFQTRNGTPFSDTNLLHQHLKPVGRKLGMPWLNWHTLRRTHATLFQQAGGTAYSEKHKRSWVTRRCPLPSKFTQSRFRRRSARQSKIFQIW